MPFARIDLAEGPSDDYRQTIGNVVYDAMIDKLGVPERDRFQVINEHRAQNFIFDPDYLGIHRSDDCVFIQLTLLGGRTLEQKSAFYKAVADGLHERLGMRREDVVINLVENSREN